MLPLRNFLPPLFFFPLLPIEIIKELFIISMLLPNFSPPSFLLPQISAKAKFPEAKTVKMHYYFLAKKQRPRNRGGGGGALGASAPLLFVPGEKVPFFGMKVLYFHGIEVPFLQNLSALLGQCPLTFEVLPWPLLRDHSLFMPGDGLVISIINQIENSCYKNKKLMTPPPSKKKLPNFVPAACMVRWN